MAERWFRLLLLVYPRRLRQSHGDEMWSTFEAHLTEARAQGAIATLGLWAREIVAASWHGSSARWREHRSRGQVSKQRRRPSERLGSLVQDARITFRGIARSPAFAIVVVVTLGIGIGANTAIFSVVKGVLLEPLSYTRADELVIVWTRFLPESGFDLPQFSLAAPEYLDYKEQSDTMADVAAFTYPSGVTLTGDGIEPERVRRTRATANLFAVLGVSPELGRFFTESEDVPNGPNVVVIGDELWQRRFGGDPAVVGRTIEINAQPQQVVGVMPAGFAYPEGAAVWSPLGLDREQDRTNRDNHYLWAIARLAPGTGLEKADAELSTIMARWAEDFPRDHVGHFLFLRTLTDETVGDVRAALLVLLAAVGFVLLIACANVANIVLARGEGRGREIAIRSALGAGRMRVLQQALVESLVLSVAGGALGLLVARRGVDLLLAVDVDALPRRANIAVDGEVLVFALLLTALTATVFGLLPALHARAGDVFSRLKTSGGSPGTSRGRHRFRAGLIVAEVAASVVLLLGAALLLKSFAHVLAVDPGFHAPRALTARMSLPVARYPDAHAAADFYGELLERVAALPFVRAASGASEMPLVGAPPNNDIKIEGRAEVLPGEAVPSGDMVVARHGYFEAMGIDVIRGRTFTTGDREGAMPVAIISRALAEKFWPSEDPIGKRFHPLFGDDNVWLTIVGIVEDVRYRGLEVEPRPAWYFPFDQAASITPWATRWLSFVVDVEGNEPLVAAEPLREIVKEMDDELIVTDVRSMDEVLYRSMARRRFIMTLLTTFAAVALVLAAIGVYGVFSFTVAEQTRELGIRGALGATRRDISVLVLRHAMTLTAIGLAVGLLGSLAATRVLAQLLYRVSPNDGATFIGVATAITAVSLTAAVIPARRAANVDPITALRTE